MSEVGISEPAARARFSTDDFPRRERVDAWSEALGRHCGVRIDVDPRSAGDFRSTAKLMRLPTFALVEGSTSPMRQESSRGLVVNDDVTFCSVTTSRWGMSQLGRSLDLHPGDWSLLSNSDVSKIIVPEKSRHLGFSVPRAAIARRVSDIGALFARRIPASNPALAMLLGYLDFVRRGNVLTTPALAAAFTDHACDLLALALGPTRDAAHMAHERGVAAARLRALLAYIEAHCCEPSFSAENAAKAHGISPRYLHRLIEPTGASFSARVNELRLQRAFALLSDPQTSHLKIADVALQCGFSDISYFNRQFRARFGDTPSSVRRDIRRLG
jgi:AraC-like DNA-binding protein